VRRFHVLIYPFDSMRRAALVTRRPDPAQVKNGRGIATLALLAALMATAMAAVLAAGTGALAEGDGESAPAAHTAAPRTAAAPGGPGAGTGASAATAAPGTGAAAATGAATGASAAAGAGASTGAGTAAARPGPDVRPGPGPTAAALPAITGTVPAALKLDLTAPGIALRARPAAPAILLAVEPPRLGALAPAPRADGSDATQVLRVPEELPTIAAALEAAPEGAVVRIAPGTYRERLTIRRAVTLAGARGAAATILEGTRGLDRILLADTAARAVRLESLTFRATPGAGADRPDGAVARGTRLSVAGCTFEGLRAGLSLEDAPATDVRANRFTGNDVAIRIRGGAPLVALNDIRGPGAFGVEAAGTDAAVALNVFSGVEVGAAFAGAGAQPLFAGNTVSATGRIGVFFDSGVQGEVRGSLFLRAGAAIVVVDGLGAADHNLFWDCAAGDYLRDPARTGALAPLLPPPGGPDVRADPLLDSALVPGPGSPAFAAGDATALARAGLGALLEAPVGPVPIGALGLPAPVPRPGDLAAAGAARPGDERETRPLAATPRDLRLLLGLLRDDCGGALRALAVRDGVAALLCERCGRTLGVRLGVARAAGAALAAAP
jgi:hypothetical protein